MYIMNAELARDITNRTMKIIPFNVNVMDANGTILASGNPLRIGELHAGALLALARKTTVEIDAKAAKNMYGAKPGINLPLMVNGQVCGAVGLSGTPSEVRQFGELVRLTAEMILEQANLTSELQRNARYREAFVLNLIKYEQTSRADLEAWGRRLGMDFERTQLVFLLELDDIADADLALTEIQRLQMRILSRQPLSLTAAIGPREMVILDSYDLSDAKKSVGQVPQRRLQALSSMLKEECQRPFKLTMGLALPGIEGVEISYQSAKAAARLGHLRKLPQAKPAKPAKPAQTQQSQLDQGQGQDQGQPQQNVWSYYDLVLPVLLSGLDSGWQAKQLRLPLIKLQAHDKNNEMLSRTLEVWFSHDGNSAATANALHIHRNTLNYRIRRINEITGLDLARMEDRLLLFVSSLLVTAIDSR